MYALFYSLYYSLFSGQWERTSWLRAQDSLLIFTDKLSTFLLNALGGNFDTMQTFSWTTNNYNVINHISALLALITMIAICTAVWKLTKMVFAIFFSRA